MPFITDDIISENGLTATTFFSTTLNATVVSATTLYGNGNNIIYNKVGTPKDSILINIDGVLSGDTEFDYSGDTLFNTGTTRFDGQFFIENSPSTKLRVQWFGSIPAGTAPGIIWTNMPALPSTWLHQTSGTFTGDATYLIDITEYTQCRLSFSVQVAAATVAATINVQWSTNNSAWDVTPLATLIIGNSTGAKDTGWTSIPAGARGLVYIRLVGTGGNGVIDPRFSPPTLLFR